MKLIAGIFKALRKIIRHRIALYKAAKLLNVPLYRVLRHDNSKFHPIEFFQYVKRFELGIDEPEKWAKAWEHHWRNNDHHIEYWENENLTFCYGDIVETEHPRITYVPNEGGWGGGVTKGINHKNKEVWIPDCALREMVADWIAASLTYSGQYPKAPDWDWGNKNLVNVLRKMEHHTQPEICTRGFAIQLLKGQGMITEEQIKQAMGF